MTWLTVLRLLLSLTDGLVATLRDRQLLEVGEAKAIAKGLEDSRAALEELRRARRDPVVRQRVRDTWTRDDRP
ncbi:hypothetical protein [Algihabitans albus]|uniref:hypothetical protein n=1 Tax=Algihabitans albus TaxID=2164067 RepID=UPI0013C2A214|nr:hypothetical protein [Algihabitans albus]